MLAQLRTVDESINAPQEVIAGDVILEPKLIEQALLHHETLAHHGPILRWECPIRASRPAANHEEFFEIGHELTSIDFLGASAFVHKAVVPLAFCQCPSDLEEHRSGKVC